MLPLHDSHVGGHVLNNHSVVTRLTCGNHTMLFAADVEHEGLSRMTRITTTCSDRLSSRCLITAR